MLLTYIKLLYRPISTYQSERSGVNNENDGISCTMFSYCNNGEYMIGECTPGQVFDLDKGNIVYYEVEFNLLF